MQITRLIFILSALFLTVMPRIASAQTIPDEARRHMARGQTAVEMAKAPDEYEPAIKEFKEAVRLAPNWSDPHYNLGVVQEKSGQFREAVASFREYLRLAPDAPDAAKIQEQIYKLEYKAELVLSVPEIIDVLVSFHQWQKDGECRESWSELYFAREGDDAVNVLNAFLYYPARTYYKTLKVTGPVLKYNTTINVCDTSADRESGGCDSVLQNEVAVVSKGLVKVNQKVLRGGVGAGVADGQSLTCTFRKK